MSSAFKRGDTAYYRDHRGTISTLTVIRVDADKAHVYRAGDSQARWVPTEQLWTEEPSWSFDRECVCGCLFGDHCDSGCIPHQIHKFQAVP